MTHSYKLLVVKCLNCGLHQIPLKQQPKNINELYSDVVDNEYLKNIKVKENTFKYALKQILPYIPNKAKLKLLEIGSYCGVFLNQTKKYDWDVKGVEPSKWAAEYSEKHYKLNIINNSFEGLLKKLNNDNDIIVS